MWGSWEMLSLPRVVQSRNGIVFLHVYLLYNMNGVFGYENTNRIFPSLCQSQASERIKGKPHLIELGGPGEDSKPYLSSYISIWRWSTLSPFLKPMEQPLIVHRLIPLISLKIPYYLPLIDCHVDNSVYWSSISCYWLLYHCYLLFAPLSILMSIMVWIWGTILQSFFLFNVETQRKKKKRKIEFLCQPCTSLC